MKGRICVLAAVVGFALLASAQSGSAGVSGKTVNSIFAKVDSAFALKGDLKPIKPVALPEGVASRKMILDELHVAFKHYQPEFRVTPRPFRIIKEYVDLNTDAGMRDKLNELIRWGLVPPAGPLVTGGEMLSPEEFGDAVGYFYVQMRRLTYQPDPQWTGALSSGGM